jgi:hypothetical protein
LVNNGLLTADEGAYYYRQSGIKNNCIIIRKIFFTAEYQRIKIQGLEINPETLHTSPGGYSLLEAGSVA